MFAHRYMWQMHTYTITQMIAKLFIAYLFAQLKHEYVPMCRKSRGFIQGPTQYEKSNTSSTLIVVYLLDWELSFC